MTEHHNTVLVLLLALQQVWVQPALQHGKVQGWDLGLDIQEGLAVGRGEGVGVCHVGASGQGVVVVCPRVVERISSGTFCCAG